MGSCLSWADKVLPIMRKMEVLKIDNTEAKVKGKMVPIWEKYMLTVDEAVLYFGIGEKKIRMLISENVDSDYCFHSNVFAPFYEEALARQSYYIIPGRHLPL